MGNDAEEGYTMDCSAGTCPRDPVGAVADWARAACDPIFTPEYLAACVPSRCWSWFRHDRYAVEVTLSAEQTWYVLVVTVRGSG
jgi:hypothetical protein